MPQNWVEILPNTCLYNIFETYLSYWGYLLAVNLQIYLKTSSLKCACKQCPKTTGVDYIAKNWALAMMLKALPLVHFWSILLLKVQMMTSVRKTSKTLVWSAQNWSISSEICPKNNHKMGWFLSIAFLRSLPRKFPRNSREIDWFFCKFVPKNPAKFDFFSWPIRSPALMTTLVFQILSTTVEPSLMATSPQPPPLYNSQFFWLTVHTLTLVSTSLRWLLCSVPKVAIGERFNCILYGMVQCMEISLKWKNN